MAVSVLSVAFKSQVKKLKKTLAEQGAVRIGLQALLRDRIIQSYNYYVEKKYIPIYAVESVASMFEQYRLLGGNGVIENLVQELKDLPHQKPERRSPREKK